MQTFLSEVSPLSPAPQIHPSQIRLCGQTSASNICIVRGSFLGTLMWPSLRKTCSIGMATRAAPSHLNLLSSIANNGTTTPQPPEQKPRHHRRHLPLRGSTCCQVQLLLPNCGPHLSHSIGVGPSLRPSCVFPELWQRASLCSVHICSLSPSFLLLLLLQQLPGQRNNSLYAESFMLKVPLTTLGGAFKILIL